MPGRGTYSRPCEACQKSPSKKKCVSEDGAPSCQRCIRKNIPCVRRDTPAPIPPQTLSSEQGKKLALSGFSDLLTIEEHDNILSVGLELASRLLRGVLVPQEFYRGLENAVRHDVRRSAHYCVFLHYAVLCLGLRHHSQLTTAITERATLSVYSEMQEFTSMIMPSSVMSSLMGMVLVTSILRENGKDHGELFLGFVHALVLCTLKRASLSPSERANIEHLNTLIHSSGTLECTLCSSRTTTQLSSVTTRAVNQVPFHQVGVAPDLTTSHSYPNTIDITRAPQNVPLMGHYSSFPSYPMPTQISNDWSSVAYPH